MFKFLFLTVAACASVYALGWLLILAIVPLAFLLLLVNQRGKN